MSARCTICKSRPLTSDSERRATVCEVCARQTGIWTYAAAIRPRLPCRGCGHMQLIRAMARERAAPHLAPLAISFAPVQGEWGGADVAADPQRAIGVIVAYVCRGCGLTELYTMAHDQLPIGPEYGTALVDVGPPVPEGPFR
jgi:hypothetical protein